MVNGKGTARLHTLVRKLNILCTGTCKKKLPIHSFSSAQDYVVSDPYPQQRRRIMAIREIGVGTENGSTRHYYEVEFENRGVDFR